MTKTVFRMLSIKGLSKSILCLLAFILWNNNSYGHNFKMSAITINGAGLFNHRLILRDVNGADVKPPNSLDWFDTHTPTMFNIPAGDYHFFSDGGNLPFTFSINGAGLIDYAANLDILLDGRGTTQLTLKGFEVTIDARYLLGAGVSFGKDFIKYGKVRLLPAPNYIVTTGSAVQAGFSFALGLNGQFDFNSKLKSFLKGCGTSTIIFEGYPLIVDGTATPGDLWIIPIWYNKTDVPGNSFPFSKDKVLLGNLLPLRTVWGDRYALGSSNPNYYFSVGLNGVFTTYSSKLKLDKFNGLSRITLMP